MNKRWGTPEPLTGKIDPVQGLHEMMDFGAYHVRLGEFDALKLNVMPLEKDEVHRYMNAVYPDVPYSVTYPSFGAPGNSSGGGVNE